MTRFLAMSKPKELYKGKAKDKTTTANEKDKELYKHQKFDDERLEKLLGLEVEEVSGYE